MDLRHGKNGTPATCKQILHYATKVRDEIAGHPRPQQLTTGWFQRFLQRHPEIKTLKYNTDKETIVKGFTCTGLCPVDLVAMEERYQLFGPNVHSEDRDDAWLKRKESVRANVLLLPPAKRARKGRKTISPSGKLITAELHRELQAAEEKKLAQKKKKMIAKQSESGPVANIVECVTI
ncbi:hypothetical protein DYB32_010489 [Aphanomyces invadans]|uniref:HTH CENPB-type domain-containing protein n=1 Tax=Aphanomyces invadans TaxID=157072 RepID=A0A3R6V2N5_9STRA|nr:hypothetical protein DYB32_010489 [Aphanomyces invadans]